MLSGSTAIPSRLELAAEAIAVRIRWFGLVVGYLLVNCTASSHPIELNAILSLGLAYTSLDTYFGVRGQIFLARYPLLISGMEALFIGLLCYFDRGLDSPFRYYYFLSLICCAIRHNPAVTYLTCGLHCLSYGVLALLLGADADSFVPFLLSLVVMIWLTWSCSALASLLKGVGEHMTQLNQALRQHQLQLEGKITERTRQLQEAQAHLLHQEKMAAFGLLAAGIAHEVGNPLTSISTIVQMLQRRDGDPYTQNKLTLVSGQLLRIQHTLRELIEFSRPASTEPTLCSLKEVLEEALGIAKYYKRTGRRIAMPDFPPDLPPLRGVRNQFVQAFLNLILNAIDAVDRDGLIELQVRSDGAQVEVCVRDNGSGISPEFQDRLFQPYFTTKKHGTGLGLFVTRKLILDHGGSVDFVSSPGVGTTFTIRLPLAVRSRIESMEEVLT